MSAESAAMSADIYDNTKRQPSMTATSSHRHSEQRTRALRPDCTKDQALQCDPVNDGDANHINLVRIKHRLKTLMLDLEPLSEVQHRNAALCWDDFDNVQVRASRSVDVA